VTLPPAADPNEPEEELPPLEDVTELAQRREETLLPSPEQIVAIETGPVGD
jgi:hypothetical protein